MSSNLRLGTVSRLRNSTGPMRIQPDGGTSELTVSYTVGSATGIAVGSRVLWDQLLGASLRSGQVVVFYATDVRFTG